MEIYKNISGQSGITSFKIGSDYIQVFFSDGSSYVYNYSSAGREAIEIMKTLARQGEGLNSYINKYVRKNYAYKA